jgi:23S rRNA pseudouridine1911/1915/1917 synthase
MPPFPILYEDNHLLAVVKPAGIPTMGVEPGRPSVLEMVRQDVKQRYAKPGNVYLGIVSRLDTPVSGVLVLARTSKAAARLAEQFRGGQVEKTYWALVEGVIEPAEGTLVDWLRADERHRFVRRVDASCPGAKQASLRYRRLRTLPYGSPSRQASLVEIALETGRKHQIRVQFSRRRHPVVGDRKYGSHVLFPAGIALHARRLVVAHPVRREPLELVAPLPPSWSGVAASEP